MIKSHAVGLVLMQLKNQEDLIIGGKEEREKNREERRKTEKRQK